MKTLSVVIPVYNEEKRIHLAFDAVKKFKQPRGVCVEKFIFVDDGSRDNTMTMLLEFKNSMKGKANIEVIGYKRNRGKGYALKVGMKKVKSDYALMLDADISIPFSNLRNFIPFMEKNYDVILGNKEKLSSASWSARGLFRTVGGWGYSFLTRVVLGIAAKDATAGFKVYSLKVCKAVFPQVRQERWGFDPEVLYMCTRFGYSMKEIVVHWHHVDSSKVSFLRDVIKGVKEMVAIKTAGMRGIYVNPDQESVNGIFALAGKIKAALSLN